ncbi:MAG: hypothetical protein WAN01_17310, partial [Bradyrhizobium sp.]
LHPAVICGTEKLAGERADHAKFLSSVPVPKFANCCGTSDANFGIKGTLAISISSAALNLKFL